MIRFVDLSAQYSRIKSEIDAAVLALMASGRFVLGREVEAFEQDFAAYCETEHAVGVSSGTSALELSLRAVDVGPGDEVITTPFTFVATAAAVLYTGARPVFVDIDPETLNIDPSRIEAAITERTKAILPVHLYGRPAEMDPILEVASRYGLTVIEDACQAHGARYKGRRISSLGHLACFSFYPGKNLGAYGDGGAVTTNDPELAAKLRLLRNWGEASKYHHEIQGYNARLDAIQAAVLRVKLSHLDAWTEERISHAERYGQLLANLPLTQLAPAGESRHVYHIFAVRTPDRDRLRAALTAAGIESGIHYPQPVHLVPAYRDLGYSAGDFPMAERAAEEVLSLPMYPELTETQIQQVATALSEAAVLA